MSPIKIATLSIIAALALPAYAQDSDRVKAMRKAAAADGKVTEQERERIRKQARAEKKAAAERRADAAADKRADAAERRADARSAAAGGGGRRGAMQRCDRLAKNPQDPTPAERPALERCWQEAAKRNPMR